MRRTAFLALASHWRRHPLQLIMLVLGLALATGLWSAVQAINSEARASYARAEAQMGVRALPRLSAPSGSVSLDRYVDLRRSGWALAPVLQGRYRLRDGSVRLMGVDFLSHPEVPATSQLMRRLDTPVRDMLGPRGLLLAHPDTATRIAGTPGLPPVFESVDMPRDLVMTDIAVAARLLQQPRDISYLLVLPDQARDLPDLAQVAPNLVLQDGRDSQADLGRLTDSFHLNLTAFGLLAFAVGLFIVHGTVGLSIEQRRGVFRTLRALGVPLRVLAGLVLGELTMLALVAGGFGLIIGYLVAAALLPDVAATLRGLYGAPVEGGLSLRPGWFLSGLAMALAGTLAASAQALWRLIRMPLLAAPGAQAWSAQARMGMAWQAGAGLLLVASGSAAVLLFDGLIAGFALLAGLMLGAALVLPWVLTAGLGVIARQVGGSRRTVQQWFWADMRAQIPGLSLALMALLLALATNVGVGTMVSSFRHTFAGWLDQRLASDLYLTARSDAEGEEIRAWLTARGHSVVPIRSTETLFAGATLRIYGIVDHPVYREKWPLLAFVPDAWDRLAAGRGVLINEQLSRREGIGVGDVIAIRPDWVHPVVGIYSDYGNPNGQVITSWPDLEAHDANTANRNFGVHVRGSDTVGPVRELRAAFGLPADAVIDQGALKAQSLAVFEKTFVVTGALNLLTLGVAVFAMLTSLLTLWSIRLPQLAPVWALGVTRRQLARLELWRSLALAAFTAVLALPLGLALAWALLAIINVQAFGWRLPMFLFPLDWLILLALALAAAGLAAALPARRLRRIAPAELLKVFADER